MRRIGKAWRLVGLATLILIILTLGGGTWFVRNPWPQEQGTVQVAGLTAPVEVRRDQWGIPQIYAQNEPDLFFAQGYVHAQDRLWQMEMNRRLAAGRLSELVGQPALSTDRFVRIMGLRRSAQREWERLSGDNRAILEAYAAGVNAYINANRSRLPVEFTVLGVAPEPWTPIDTLSWGKVLGWNLEWNSFMELLRARLIATHGVEVTQAILPPYADGPALSIPPEVKQYPWGKAALQLGPPLALAGYLDAAYLSQGSNNWVVHGSRTASGLPLLANDTHLSLGMPSIWYLNGLHGGRFSSSGFTFPGIPLVLIGHNDQIAWGVTNLPADVQDLYVEQVDDRENPRRYVFKGQWYDLETVQEVIAVRGSATVTEQVRLTRHGPLINGSDANLAEAEPLALRWPLIEGAGVFTGLTAVNLARDWESFRAALRSWEAPSQHFVYADRQGNIGYQAAGSLPRRVAQHQGLVPVPGWTGEYEWQGFLDIDQLYHTLNPPAGFIASANDRVVGDDYPHTMGYEWGDPYRIAQITQLLAGNDQATAADMRAMQSDTYMQPAALLRPYLLQVQASGDIQARALDQLRNWNLRADIDQPGQAIFRVWYSFLLRETLGDDIDTLLGSYQSFRLFHTPFMVSLMDQPRAEWFDDRTTSQIETRDDMVQRSFVKAVDLLRSRLGDAPERWTWGQIHTTVLRHEPFGRSGIWPIEQLFNSPSLPAPGDHFTINTGWSSETTYRMGGGVSQRMIIDMSDLDAMRVVNATGQSGHVLHPNRNNMIELWQRGEDVGMPFSREAVAATATTALVLTP